MFSHYTRILAHVPRWAIVPTIKSQSVAEHSYFVSLYVAELLEKLFNEKSADWKYQALRYALVHDAAECRMSDIPGPIKRSIRDDQKYGQVEHDILTDMGYSDGWECDPEIKALVKAADLIDEYLFMRMERSLGSKIVQELVNGVESRMLKSIRALCELSNSTWAVEEHIIANVHTAAERFDDGIATWPNNDDLPKGCGCGPWEGCPVCDIPF